jgi:hypothetical protein
MAAKRTETERAGALLEIQKLQATPGWKIYEAEVLRIKDATASGMFRETPDGRAVAAGVLHGIDIALNITSFINAKV